MTAPPETLEALVKDELRGPVTELVREQLNGDLQAAAETAVSGPENTQETATSPGQTPGSPRSLRT